MMLSILKIYLSLWILTTAVSFKHFSVFFVILKVLHNWKKSSIGQWRYFWYHLAYVEKWRKYWRHFSSNWWIQHWSRRFWKNIWGICSFLLKWNWKPRFKLQVHIRRIIQNYLNSKYSKSCACVEILIYFGTIVCCKQYGTMWSIVVVHKSMITFNSHSCFFYGSDRNYLESLHWMHFYALVEFWYFIWFNG